MTRSIRAGLVAVAMSGAVVSTSVLAMAQGVKETPAAAAGAGDKAGGEGYGYEFDDDPLAAGGFGPNDARIQVRQRAPKTTLIRPRTSFVPEMLKSVENL